MRMETRNRKPIVGVLGPGEGATPEDTAAAETPGQLLAEAGWSVLSGGRTAG
jgi:hypothetical protein